LGWTKHREEQKFHHRAWNAMNRIISVQCDKMDTTKLLSNFILFFKLLSCLSSMGTAKHIIMR